MSAIKDADKTKNRPLPPFMESTYTSAGKVSTKGHPGRGFHRRSFDMDPLILVTRAREAAENAYAPYSRFRVGAALLCSDGSVITGSNVENRSFGLTNCAERSAVFTAVSLGKKEFRAIAVSCIDADYPVSPCGACRQVLSEFVPSGFPIYFSDKTGKWTATTMGELFPYDALHDLGGN